MKVFVLGNINAGKSTLIDVIQKNLSGYKILKIDAYRRIHCDGSIEKEEKMWTDFPAEVMKYDDVIVEFSGFGHIADHLINLLPDHSCIVLYVKSSVDECIRRISEAKFTSIPYAKFVGAETLEQTINRIGIDLDHGELHKKWGKKALHIIECNSGEMDLPLLQYHYIFRLRDILIPYSECLFLFGSAGRQEMTSLSDVDMFCLTKTPVQNIAEKLSKIFTSIDIMGNEIIVRDNGILMELYCIEDIEEARVFYRESAITDIVKSVIIDNIGIIPKLTLFSSEEVDYEKEISHTISRLKYYVESLKTLAKKKDQYKYFFHNNIVVHECVRIKAFSKGHFRRNYLPLHAKDYFTNEEWDILFYHFGDDMDEHYYQLKIFVKKVLYDFDHIR